MPIFLRALFYTLFVALFGTLATFGFGLAFSKQALDFLGKEDPDTLAALRPALETWSDSVLYLNGERVRIDGMDYAGIARLKLLRILAQRAQGARLDVLQVGRQVVHGGEDVAPSRSFITSELPR